MNNGEKGLIVYPDSRSEGPEVSEDFPVFFKDVNSQFSYLKNFVGTIDPEEVQNGLVSDEEKEVVIRLINKIIDTIISYESSHNNQSNIEKEYILKKKEELRKILEVVFSWGIPRERFKRKSESEKKKEAPEEKDDNEKDKFNEWNKEFIEKLIALDERIDLADNNGDVAFLRQTYNELYEEYLLKLDIFSKFITNTKQYETRFKHLDEKISSKDQLFYIYSLTELISAIEEKMLGADYDSNQDLALLRATIEDASNNLSGFIPAKRVLYQNGIIAEAAKLLEKLKKLAATKDEDKFSADRLKNRDKILVDLFNEIETALIDAEAKTNYLVDEQQNDINVAYHRVLELLDNYQKESPNQKDLFRAKEKVAETFYRIYRAKLLEEMEYFEKKYISFGGVHWKSVLEDKLLAEMQNLSEKHMGFKLDSITKLEVRLKEAGGADSETTTDKIVEQILIDNNVSPENINFYRELIKDYLNVQKEYLARRYSHRSWTEIQPKVLPKEGIRAYPDGVYGDTHPILFAVDYLINQGLAESRFGKGTNKVIEKDKKSRIKSSEIYGETEEVVSSTTVFGDAWRALDRWATGNLIFEYENGEQIRTGRAHAAEEAIVIALTDYLNKKNKFKGDKKIEPNSMLRAYRSWAIVTFHQSARAISSAEGPDQIYYMHKFHQYNAGYVAAGTYSWQPLVTEMIFGSVDPATGKKINPLQYVWGDLPEMGSHKSFLDNWSPIAQGFSAARKALDNHGYLRPSQKRLEEEGFATYNFLLSPLLTMPDLFQAENWVEKVDQDGNYTKVRVSDLPENERKHDSDGNFTDDQSETFTEQPLLATVFIRDEDGKAIRYPSERKADGTEVKGKPISFFDRQDEFGEIMYETLPWSENVQAQYAALNSLGSNGFRFLTDFLKSKDFLSSLKDPTKVSTLKNDGKYVMMHLPSLGTLFAAGMQNQEADLKMLPKALMNMLIAQLVFVGVIIKTDVAAEDHWSILEIEKYLDELVAKSGAISSETAEAILIAIKGAKQFNIRASAFAHEFLEGMKNRLKHS